MSTIKRIAKNTGFLLLGRILSKILSLIVVIQIARYLGDIGYGKYAFAFAFVSFFEIISQFGMHSILVREVARNQICAGKTLGNATIILTLFSIVAMFLAVLVISTLRYPADTQKLVHVAALSLLFGSFIPFGVIYEITLKMQYSAFFSLVSRIFLLCSVFVIIFFDMGLTCIVLLTVVADLFHNILMVFFSRKFVNFKFEFDPSTCKFLLRESLPLALSSVFMVVYFRIDVVMLSILSGDSAVGLYSAAYRLTEAFIFIPVTFMTSMFPLMARYFNESRDTLFFAFRKSFKYLFILALPIAAGTTVLSEKIILLIYDETFSGSSSVLGILIWAIAFLFLNSCSNQLLISTNKQKITTISTAICAFINVVLNLILIPRYSYTGAAVATVITELVNFFFLSVYLPKEISKKKIIYDNRVVVISTLVMVIFVLLVNNLINILLVIFFSVLVYFFSIFIFGGFDNDDTQIILKLFNR